MLRALSVKQPWALLITHGLKDIENRSWSVSLAARGPVLIHASKQEDVDATALIDGRWHPATGERLAEDDPIMRLWRSPDHMGEFGGIVGMATITDCVTGSSSPWFQGPFGLVLADARVLPFTPLRGAQRFFYVDQAAVRGL